MSVALKNFVKVSSCMAGAAARTDFCGPVFQKGGTA
jgi:hypothetical protein